MGGLDCLVNNAGAIDRTPSSDFDEAVYEQVFDLNTRSILRMVRHAAPGAVKESKRASIINLGSIRRVAMVAWPGRASMPRPRRRCIR